MIAATAEADLTRAASQLDRRAFLRLAAAGAAAGILPSGCSRVPPELVPRAETELAVLSPRSYATFTAAASSIVGPDGAALIAAHQVDVGLRADAWLARTPALAGPLVQALLVLEHGFWPLVAKLKPFTALLASERDAVLADLMTSRLDLKRALFQGVRALSLLAFYSDPASRELSGYPGPFGNERVTIRAGMVT